MEAGGLHVDVRDCRGGDHLGQAGRVAGSEIAEMVAEDRHLRVAPGEAA